MTLGSVGTAIAGFAVEDEDSPEQQKGGISQGTVQMMTLIMLPVSIVMIAYALFTFYWRSEFIRKKQASSKNKNPKKPKLVLAALSFSDPCFSSFFIADWIL